MTYYKLVHDRCGGVSLYFNEDPTRKILNHNNAVYPTGIRPKEGNVVMCGNCHHPARCVDEHLYEVTDADELKNVERLFSIT